MTFLHLFSRQGPENRVFFKLGKRWTENSTELQPENLVFSTYISPFNPLRRTQTVKISFCEGTFHLPSQPFATLPLPLQGS